MKPYAWLGIRNRTLWEGYGILESYLRPIWGSDCMIEKALDFGVGYADRLCDDVEERKRLRLLMEKEIREGKYTQEFFDAIDKAYKDAVQDIKTFWRADLANASPDELLAYVERYKEIYITTLHPMILAIYASDLGDFFDKELRETLKDEHPSQLDIIDNTALLLTPTRLTNVQKEEQMLIEIERSFAEAGEGDRAAFDAFTERPDISRRFEALAESFGWFHMEYIGEAKTADDYRALLWGRIEEMRKAGIPIREQLSPEERLADTIARQKAFFDTHPASDVFKKLVFAMQEFLIVLDFSKADLIEGIWYGRPLLAELGRRTGLNSWVDVRFLMHEELRDLLKNGRTVGTEYIRERKERFTLILEDGVITTYFGAEAKAKVEELVQTDEIENEKEFKGMTAFPGLVRGIACVVTNAAGRDKFQQGQILVTIDTTTELTSIIKKSIAIVADQGGLLSHTAIVSREFKIPCLVRTRVGTQLVKDGDEIEVDATNGVVRILS